MPTPSEGRALLFVAAVAALGLGVRGWRAIAQEPAPVADREALAQQIARVDSAVMSGGRRARPRSGEVPQERQAAGRVASVPADAPPAAPTIIDVDRATAEELDQLPGIGPALAARIVADRETNGPFGSMEALEEVRGIGPALAAKLAPRVSFSAPPRPPTVRSQQRSRSTP